MNDFFTFLSFSLIHLISSPKNETHQPHSKDSRDRRHPQCAQYLEAVFPGRRIVVETIKHQFVSDTSDLAFGRFHDPEFYVLGGIIDAVKITRQLPIRCSDHDRAAVSELAAFFVPLVAETG